MNGIYNGANFFSNKLKLIGSRGKLVEIKSNIARSCSFLVKISGALSEIRQIVNFMYSINISLTKREKNSNENNIHLYSNT